MLWAALDNLFVLFCFMSMFSVIFMLVQVQRLYERYLRAESYRKSLVYQKRYLLLLLGGFQECEEATLSLIARMGGHPTHTCPESLGRRRRGFTRFRSAVRVSIALSRY